MKVKDLMVVLSKYSPNQKIFFILNDYNIIGEKANYTLFYNEDELFEEKYVVLKFIET